MNILLDLFLTFAKIGAFTFGGGYAMLSLLDCEIIEKKGWLTSDELSDLTVVAESTPGPIAINCSTYTGYKQAGFAGAVVSTVGMVLPSCVIILLISYFFENLLAYPIAANAFKGIRIAVSVLIMRAALKMLGKMLKKPSEKAGAIAFAAVFFAVTMVLNFCEIHFSTIYLIMIAGVFGFCLFGLRRRGTER